MPLSYIVSMAEIMENKAPVEMAARRFLTFRCGRHLYALPADEIAEIIRTPPVSQIPQSPKSLLGVANLRGSVLPVASLRALLGHEEKNADSSARAIVLEGAAPIAIAVDAVDALVSLDHEPIETRQTELAGEPGEMLRGMFKAASQQHAAKILDIQGLLTAAFVQRSKTKRTPGIAPQGRLTHQFDEKKQLQRMLVTFEVASQEYAFGLDAVQEIIPAPETIALIPRTETLVLGVTAFRDRLLPLLSLRGLLGFAQEDKPDQYEKVIVTAVAGTLVGLVVDRMCAIVRADLQQIDPTPSMLAARTGGETKISAIYRAENGQKLIPILAQEQLFREDVMKRLGDRSDAPEQQHFPTGAIQKNESQFLVFRLGAEEFALPIVAVDEVTRVPDQITRVPKTPKFLEGIINLRGEVLPVIDQRRRFNLAEFQGDQRRRRLIVVRTDSHRAGLIVDSVSEVLRTANKAIEAAPELTNETTRLIHGMINLDTSGRIVLLLDPAELLNRAERKMLDQFGSARHAVS